MKSVSIADAKARLSELVDLAAAGNVVRITRRGKPIAQITAMKAPSKPIDFAALRALTDSMPMQRDSSARFVRKMRDKERH
jgi:prevent-host-death family protein